MAGTIRPPADDDVPVLVALAEALGYPCQVSEMRERLAFLDGRSGHVVRVVSDDADCPLGWIHAFESAQLTGGPFVEIAGLVIDDRARGIGLGKCLVDAVAAWAKARGIYRLRVHSRVSRTGAHRFYRRLGFEQTKTQHVFQHDLKGAPVATEVR
ncbi:GNAT family N-acetyltransferase [Aidingimonas lacisalsi]|uniref:GNAT family N-acetyltransferase n=1 Tax=Aidingimonas lacisalsi TaxID=2604086 RepID=UPI0011D2707F|nr:GNAT family N-acetyltransferase [Aidingimonas lacisalsi]